jgi:hypothetical protein
MTDLQKREQALLQEAGVGVIVTGADPIVQNGWSALRSFLRDIGCHDAVLIVDRLEEVFQARGAEEFL